VMLLVAIPYVRSGRLDGIYLAFLVLVALSSFEVIEPLTTVAQQLGSSVQAARRLFEVVDAPPMVRDAEGASPEPGRYDVSIEHLMFRYEAQGSWVLDDVGLEVEQGECVAIVGPSGAGKSTLANVLLRFWEYERGSVKLGGYELREYRQENIHQLISVVEQRTYLFNGTIRENLLVAKADASEEEIEQAVKRARLDDFIKVLPDGYQTLVGEQGFKLSGGERQRLAVARALLKDAPILILDEATAHLDAITEHEMLETLRELIHGRTTIMITHRLVGLEMANEIVVMERGKIRERGTQAELVQAEGLYWRMWEAQRQVVTEQLASRFDAD
jgi:ATP-binding cassette, subfamily C, bacterial CydC